MGFSEERTDFFVENVDWIARLFDGEPFALLDDADGDGAPNTYDYTPLPGIDLTLRLSVSLRGGRNVGDASAPFPIFNIWQLQAIGGATVQGIESERDRQMSVASVFRKGITLLNLRGQYYRLSVDIDASPTRDWNDGKGFAPIRFSSNNNFNGGLDGGGKVVRDLYINRPDENEVGLFSFVQNNGSIADIGLQNVVAIGAQSGGSDCGADTIWRLPH